ncbi:MAG: hypothetical protein K6G76_03865 [Lachnospiraceae bacterium]|nr:hypothetical protein [Lachnospiraceae bacterium]
MKKTLMYLSLALCMLAVAFSVSTVTVNAASNTKLMTNYLKAYKNKNYKKAKSYLNKMKKTDKDTSLKKMSKKQKKAYMKVVKKYAKNLNIMYGDYLWGYYLADLNKDKKAELLIQYGSCEADVRTYVYTFKKGKAKKVAKTYSGHTGYVSYPGKGVVQVWGHMGYCSVSVLTMQGNKLKAKNYGSQDTTKSGEEYCLPGNYLNSHIKYDAHYNRSVDYSDLK